MKEFSEEKLCEASALLQLLSNKQRLMIVCLLHDGSMSVGELNQHFDLSQSALSQHLAKLRSAGVVSTKKEAQTVYYHLSHYRAIALISALHQLFCESS